MRSFCIARASISSPLLILVAQGAQHTTLACGPRRISKANCKLQRFLVIQPSRRTSVELTVAEREASDDRELTDAGVSASRFGFIRLQNSVLMGRFFLKKNVCWFWLNQLVNQFFTYAHLFFLSQNCVINIVLLGLNHQLVSKWTHSPMCPFVYSFKPTSSCRVLLVYDCVVCIQTQVQTRQIERIANC